MFVFKYFVYLYHKILYKLKQESDIKKCTLLNTLKKMFRKGIIMDRRAKKTKAAIYTSFTELLSKKGYYQITIQEIIDLADVGRSTFYSHFETKDELLKSMCLDIFKDITSLKHSFDTSNPHSIITGILYHLKDNKKTIKGVFASQSGDLFMNYFKEYFNDQIDKLLFTNFDEKSSAVPKDFLINHISGSFIEMIKWWILTNMKQTPEELTSYYLAIITPIITQIKSK